MPPQQAAWAQHAGRRPEQGVGLGSRSAPRHFAELQVGVCPAVHPLAAQWQLHIHSGVVMQPRHQEGGRWRRRVAAAAARWRRPGVPAGLPRATVLAKDWLSAPR